MSRTVMLKDAGDELLPLLSRAVQLTAVVSNGNVLPDAGVQFTAGEASPLSVAAGAA